MEGAVTWPQLYFAAGLLVVAVSTAAWVMVRMTDILVRMEQLATKQDLAHMQDRLNLQWNNWMEAQGEMLERIARLEGVVARLDGAMSARKPTS